jgi:hypothetical protein
MILSYINFSMVWLCLQLMMKLLVLLHKQVCMRKIIMHFRTSITIITNVTTPTSGLQLGVECKGTWGLENVFRCETHFQKWGKVQEMEPNDSQMHFHFGSYICVGVPNVQNLGWKGKKKSNWAPKIPLERSWITNA